MENKIVRSSGIELFRIITMLSIIAHHYVVNSGLIPLITPERALETNSLFLLLLGCGGKTGINCFVLITGYFMCKSQITLRKFLKLFLEVMFYRILIYAIFLGTGYIDFSVKQLIKTIIPITALETNFTSCYLVFYLFIPFLNILVNGMNKKQHILLIGLLVSVYTFLPTMFMSVIIGYVGWFAVIYIIGSYIRLYPCKYTENRKTSIYAAGITLILSWLSVLCGAILYNKTGLRLYYHFLADSNKVLSLITAVACFIFFKNLKLRYNKVINTAAASAFGVLLIHANSSDMRQWLWQDVLNNVSYFNSKYLIVHAVVSIICIYIVCMLIDILRIKFLEKPLFSFFDKSKILN